MAAPASAPSPQARAPSVKPAPGAPETHPWTGLFLLAIAAVVPAAIAAVRIDDVAPGARDAALPRVLALEPRVWRGLDTAIGLLLQAIPIGTREARAAAGGALVAGAAGVLVAATARGLLAACAPTRRLGSVVATLAALLAVAAPAWQTECSVLGGSATGALLVLLPLALLARVPVSDAEGGSPDERLVAIKAAVFAVGLALGYEPAVGVAALVGAGVFAAAHAPTRRALASCGPHAGPIGAAFAASLFPWCLGLARARAAGASLGGMLAAGWAFEGLAPASPVAAASPWSQLGGVTLLFAAAGLVLAGLATRARPTAAGLVGVALAGAAASRFVPVGTSPFTAPALAAIAAVCALAGAGMHGLVRAVSEARVPMAGTSASLIVVLELVLPVDSIEEALARSSPGAAVAAWDDVAWGELPPSTVVALTRDLAWQRTAAAQARGSLRGDVTVIATDTGASSGSARRALASDPALLPVWRDLEMSGMPTEASLAAVAATRPLAMAYEPRWGRVVAEHLVPDGLFDRFELEPRGASDRRLALAAFAPRRSRLALAVRDDADVRAASAILLRPRALLFATLDARDPDSVAGALADVRAFAGDDSFVARIAARMAAKSPQRFDDLAP
jgi:hypothetical protein